MGKSTISMAIFNSKLLVYQRVFLMLTSLPDVDIDGSTSSWRNCCWNWCRLKTKTNPTPPCGARASCWWLQVVSNKYTKLQPLGSGSWLLWHLKTENGQIEHGMEPNFRDACCFVDFLVIPVCSFWLVTPLFLVCHTSNIPGKHMGKDTYPSSSFRFLTNI